MARLSPEQIVQMTVRAVRVASAAAVPEELQLVLGGGRRQHKLHSPAGDRGEQITSTGKRTPAIGETFVNAPVVDGTADLVEGLGSRLHLMAPFERSHAAGAGSRP